MNVIYDKLSLFFPCIIRYNQNGEPLLECIEIEVKYDKVEWKYAPQIYICIHVLRFFISIHAIKSYKILKCIVIEEYTLTIYVSLYNGGIWQRHTNIIL